MMCNGWSKDPKPDWTEWSKKYLWRPGDRVIDGDSDAFPINPDNINRDAFLAAFPGKVPENSIKEFPKFLERHKKNAIKEVYVQLGGNMWTWYPLESLDMNLSVFQKQMGVIIDFWLSIVPAKDITIASLPFVYPKLRYSDMKKYHGSSSEIRKLMNLRLNDIFLCANIILKTMCSKKGVQYLDIFFLLEALWKTHGKSWWWDTVHCDNRARAVQTSMIKAAWSK